MSGRLSAVVPRISPSNSAQNRSQGRGRLWRRASVQRCALLSQAARGPASLQLHAHPRLNPKRNIAAARPLSRTPFCCRRRSEAGRRAFTTKYGGGPRISCPPFGFGRRANACVCSVPDAVIHGPGCRQIQALDPCGPAAQLCDEVRPNAYNTPVATMIDRHTRKENDRWEERRLHFCGKKNGGPRRHVLNAKTER